MKHLKHSVIMTFLLGLAACGGGAPPAPPPVTQTIGAAGGTVNGPSGATVVIPAGALAQDTPIGIAQTNAGAPALPAGTTTFGAMFAFTPHGTVFAKPVTMTVPFDPGKVLAVTTPVLLKTNAAMNGWDVVAGATVSGNVMTAQVTSFSLLTVVPQNGLLRGDPTRDWEFKAFIGDGTLKSLKMPPLQTGGLVDDTYRYNGGGIGNVHSTEDGKTYWAFASSPKGSILDAGSQIGDQVLLHHLQTFTKVDASASLKLTITAVTLSATEIYDSKILPYECVVEPECDLYAYAWVSFWVNVYGEDHEGKYWSFMAGSHAEFSDRGLDVSRSTPCKRDWKFDVGVWSGGRVWDDQVTPLWEFDDFVGSSASNNCGRTFKLAKPITIFINLSKVDVGKDFTLETNVQTSTYQEAGGEGGLLAYFRDPVSPVGGSLEYTGLVPSSNPRTPRQTPEPLPECDTGPDPAAGVLQFSAASYNQKEGPFSRNPVSVTRTGGSKGAVSVRLRSSDDTAHAGQDYTSLDTVVHFGDGDSSPRMIEVPIVADTIPEPDKNLTLTLSDARGCAALGAQKTATLNILDNDRLLPPPETHTLGGTVSGLAGSGLVLQDKLFVISQATPSGNGPFTLNFNYRPNTAYDVQVVAQPSNPIQTCSVTNGKGTITTANVTNVAVNCVTPGQNPALDPTFGSGGKAFLPGASAAMALQPDGKIVTIGGGTNSFLVTRINPNGSLDTGFGAGGTVKTDFPAPVGSPPFIPPGVVEDGPHAVAIQSDGKIVVVGGAATGFVTGGHWFSDFALARYNPDGSLDGSFGKGGLVTTDFGGDRDRAYAVAIQADGKIVVAGDVSTSTNVDFGLARYNANGSLDSSFDGDGKVTTDLSSSTDLAREMVLQADGKIVMVGPVAHLGSGGLDDTGLVRYNADGSLDGSFGPVGSSGKVILPNTSASNAMLIQPDGKIVLGGNAFTGVSHGGNFLVMRLTASGSLDTGFGNGGKATTDFSPSFLDSVSALALQADGKIVAAGSRTFDSPAAGGGDFALARFSSNGTLDGSFDGDGKLTVDFFGSSDFATNVAVQPDGKIVVGGSAKNGSSGGIGLVRVNP